MIFTERVSMAMDKPPEGVPEKLTLSEVDDTLQCSNEYQLDFCRNCNQMTNHLLVCQKCEVANSPPLKPSNSGELEPGVGDIEFPCS